jgi:hypothetical protein
MSSISAAVVNSISNTTNLTLTTGNTSGPSMILYAGSPTITLFANNSGISALVANNSGITVPTLTAASIVAGSISSTSGSLTTNSVFASGGVEAVTTAGNYALRAVAKPDDSNAILQFTNYARNSQLAAITATNGYLDFSATGRFTGDLIAYYSDDRLKNRHENIPNALGKVKSLNGFYYSPNKTALNLGLEQNQLSKVGVSAQEVQAILPEAVKEAPIGQGYLTVQYEKLVPLLIEAVKELSAKIEELESKSCNCGCK